MRCIDEKIEYQTLRRLNYRDLQALLIEREVQLYEKRLRELAQQENANKGRNVRRATANDIKR